ncbi:MAG: hypothetical protein ACQKBY_08395 [Verrucomicrobiales bacterium]
MIPQLSTRRASAVVNNQQETTLRFTETNSSEDSKGKTWGLDGNLFWFAIGGAFLKVMTLLILFAVFKWPIERAFGVALVPLILSFVYIFGFRQGKPPGYDRDFLDNILNGPAITPAPIDKQPSHPISSHVQ